MSFSNSEDFFEIWRFEECADLMTEINSGRIVLFGKEQSSILWSMFVSPDEKHMMKLDMSSFSGVFHYDVDFEDERSADKLFLKFDELSGSPENVFLFFSEKYLCITPFSLLKKYWNHFFLPSDETTVVITAQNRCFLFSYEERFFIVTR